MFGDVEQRAMRERENGVGAEKPVTKQQWISNQKKGRTGRHRRGTKELST